MPACLSQFRPRAGLPLANYAIMLATVCVFAVQMLLDPAARHLSGMVLCKGSVLSLLGYMWLHLTMVHLVGNLIALWVFGHHVCPRLGNVTYAIAYIAVGVGAGFVHIAYDGRPVIGSSGAIMGILGIYVVTCFGQLSSFRPWLILTWFLATLGAGIVGGLPAAYMSHARGFLSGMVLAVGIMVYRMVVGDVMDPALSAFLRSATTRP